MTLIQIRMEMGKKTEDEKKLQWVTSGWLLITRYRLYSSPQSTTHWAYTGMSKKCPVSLANFNFGNNGSHFVGQWLVSAGS